MDDLLKYFIEESNKKHEQITKEIQEVRVRLDDLQKFKIEMIASARLGSLIVSSLCGFITLLVTLFASHWLK